MKPERDVGRLRDSFPVKFRPEEFSSRHFDISLYGISLSYMILYQLPETNDTLNNQSLVRIKIHNVMSKLMVFPSQEPCTSWKADVEEDFTK